MPAPTPAAIPRSLVASDHGSAWVARSPREAPMATDAAVASNVHADVCIVGAGIAGMTAAYLLAKEGRSVTVLEVGPAPAVGETSRSTAQMATAIDDRLYEIERMHGEEGARRTVQSQAAAIDLVERVSAAENIDCDFERLDGFLFAAPDTDPAELDRELAAYHRLGFADVEKTTDRRFLPPGAPPVGPALRFPRQAQFDPVRYVDGLAAAVRRLGGTIRFNTRVESVTSKDGEATIGLEGGGELRAGWAIVASNTPFNDRVVMHTKQGAYRSYVVALRIPAGLAPRALVWDNLEAYHYVRLMPDDAGDGTTELLLVGGEDHKTGQDDLPPEERFLRLEAWGRQHYPGVTTVAHRWSGQVMEPEDGLPFIGRNPLDAENILIATGDSGMGTTNGTAAGILLADLVQGRENPWATLYDPARKMMSSAGVVGEFLHENLNVGRQYLDLVTPGDVSTSLEIAPGASAIIRKGLTKVAVHRDAAGALHCLSAVCPHLGGIVRWNEEAKSWDCPCHGSRFGIDGAVLNGPSASGLEARSL